MTDPKPFRIEVGKRYVTQDGKVTGPVYVGGSTFYTHPLLAVVEGEVKSYSGKGRYFFNYSSQQDLVAEYIEETCVKP